MRSKWKLSAPLVAVVAALVVVTAGFASSARYSSSTALLRVATTAGVTTWDPIKSFSTEVLYMANIDEPLVYANPPVLRASRSGPASRRTGVGARTARRGRSRYARGSSSTTARS